MLVTSGVQVDAFTFPFLHRVELGDLGGPLTVLALVLLMNVVNFSDGVDGLAAGVCAISAAAFSIIAFDLGRNTAGILAAIVCGAALGFLVFNFHPASVFMGDCGSNLLGLLLGAVIVEGTLKTNALIALVGPLVVLAVPFLDTGFVVAKRIKYRRPSTAATPTTSTTASTGSASRSAGRALPLRVDADDGRRRGRAALHPVLASARGHLDAGWALLMGALLLLGVAASVYLVYVLEILKLRRLRAWQLRRDRPGHERARDRRAGRARARDRRVPRRLA